MIDVSDAETTEKEAPSDKMKDHPCSKCESKATWSIGLYIYLSIDRQVVVFEQMTVCLSIVIYGGYPVFRSIAQV